MCVCVCVCVELIALKSTLKRPPFDCTRLYYLIFPCVNYYYLNNYVQMYIIIYREAEESGKRQREERLRRTEDEIFKQMMRVHTGSVESYLEDVILASVEKTADDQARQEIQKQAQAINQVAHQYQYR